MKSTAIAYANIALVKYWGKRDEQLILPYNSSISMTLDELYTTTTVEFSRSYNQYSISINGIETTGVEAEKIIKHLELLKSVSDSYQLAKVVSESNFPKKAGLASSASGFAALTLAASKALGLTLSEKDLSIFARRGSGSASRSIHGGFVKWNKGEKPDGSDSFAVQIAESKHWSDLSMLVTVVSPKEKKVSSRTGMKQTVKTSQLYKAWLETINVDLKNVEKAILEKNFPLLGSTLENNALKMHSTMHTTNPPIIYWEAGSLIIMKEVISLREEGVECYFTMDAGPQVKILCLEKDISKISERINRTGAAQDWFVCRPGERARIIEKHLF